MAGADEREPAVAEVLAIVRAAWPRVQLAEAAFARHLERHLPPGADRATVLRWHLGDLYLACASGHGDTNALAAFDAAHMSAVPAMLSRLRGIEPSIDDVKQMVREKLFVAGGAAAAEPKILGYSGAAPLAGWLRVVVTRTAVGHLRSKSASPADEIDEDLHGLVRTANPEIDLLRVRYRAEFDAAVRDAFARVGVRERTLLRLHLVEGVSLDGVGAAYGVHRATAARWIAAARAEVFDMTRRLLSERLAIGPAEFESLVRAMRSGLDVSLRDVLGEAPAGGQRVK
jgi:RNA polymerase sigma-70 factor (ECF subfamily)